MATAGLNPGDVAYPAGGFVRRYGAIFRHGELAAIDSASGRIKLTNGLELGYDYLVIATGVSAAYHGIKGRPTTRSACTRAPTRSCCAITSWPPSSG